MSAASTEELKKAVADKIEEGIASSNFFDAIAAEQGVSNQLLRVTVLINLDELRKDENAELIENPELRKELLTQPGEFFQLSCCCGILGGPHFRC